MRGLLGDGSGPGCGPHPFRLDSVRSAPARAPPRLPLDLSTSSGRDPAAASGLTATTPVGPAPRRSTAVLSAATPFSRALPRVLTPSSGGTPRETCGRTPG